MSAEAYRVRAIVEPGTVVDHDRMSPAQLAGLLEGIARRLIGSDLTEISLLTVKPSDPGG